MNSFRVVMQTLYAGVLVCGLISSAGAQDVRSFGRAGGQVGADAIAQVVRLARLAGGMPDAFGVTIYGHAGKPVGADAVNYVTNRAAPSKARGDVLVSDWYGRAGGATRAARSQSRTDRQLAQFR
jgi:hypothetical protein